MNVGEKLQELKDRLKDVNFRQGPGQVAGSNYLIFDYPPSEELKVRDFVTQWAKHNNKDLDGYRLMVYDLYEMIIQYLEDENLVEECFQLERENGLVEVCDALKSCLELDQTSNYFVKKICESSKHDDVILLTGIGKSFPMVRSHSILNTLFQRLAKATVILFFPGEYDMRELKLFGTVHDGNYYRAVRFSSKEER